MWTWWYYSRLFYYPPTTFPVYAGLWLFKQSLTLSLTPLIFQVQMSSPSPQRSVSRFPPRLSYATSCPRFHPPAPTQPARTQRLVKRMMRRRRRRQSKEVVSEGEGEGGEGHPLWWPRMKKKCIPTWSWWTGRTERTRPAKTGRITSQRFEEIETGFKQKHAKTQSCEITLGYTTILAFFLNLFHSEEKQ